MIVRPGLPGVAREIDVQVPSLTMKDVGRGVKEFKRAQTEEELEANLPAQNSYQGE